AYPRAGNCYGVESLGNLVVERPVQMGQGHVDQNPRHRLLGSWLFTTTPSACPWLTGPFPATPLLDVLRKFPQWTGGRVGQFAVRTALTASHTEAANTDFAPSGICRSNPAADNNQPALSSTSNALPSPTLLTTSKSQPLCWSLTRA